MSFIQDVFKRVAMEPVSMGNNVENVNDYVQNILEYIYQSIMEYVYNRVQDGGRYIL